MTPITHNLHTHTWRCKHASGTEDQLAREALSRGLKHLGLSDHTPLPDGWFEHIRMPMQLLPDYVACVNRAKADHPGLNIYLGLECDYFAQYEGFFQQELRGRYAMDYLIGSIHGFPLRGERVYTQRTPMDTAALRAYADHMIRAMDSGLFDFIAHPDLFSATLSRWDDNIKACCRDILSAAQAIRIPLEINVSGWLKQRLNPGRFIPFNYPHPSFWELAADYRTAVVITSDCHSVDGLTADLEAGYKLAEAFDLPLATPDFLRP